MGGEKTVAGVDVPTKRSQQRCLPVGSLSSVALSGESWLTLHSHSDSANSCLADLAQDVLGSG